MYPLRPILLLLFFSFTLTGWGQKNGKTSLEASYTEEEIKLDGRLKEEIWKEVDKAANFIQRDLHVGEPATEKTQVAVAYDDNSLYIAAWCYDDNPEEILARELKRDFSNSNEDDIHIILDTYNDDRNGFHFITNPNGARKDAQIINNGDSYNVNWDGVWDAATAITSEGWFVEVKIPFTTLKYPNNKRKQVWGINFERNIRRKREQVRWQGWSRDAEIQQVVRAGDLTGLEKLRSKDFVEIKPYGLAGIQFGQDNETVLNAGGDINYSITPTVRAKLTVNTDFAQVESDQQQINLSRFPLFYPERREFFLEGQDYFNMGYGGNRVTPFYSRRIGLTKSREQVPILAGGRVLGKQGPSTIGAMSLQTGRKDTIPSTNYTVASWRGDVGNQSTIGAMTVNKYREGRWHSTTGVNGRYGTNKLFGDKNFSMSGAYIHTYNSDTTFDPKAGAFRVQASYPNDQLFIFTSFQRSPAPFNPEVGLMRRRNFQEAFGMVNWEPRPNPNGWLGWIQQFRFSPGMLTYTYFDDTYEMQTFLYQIQPFGFTTRSGENMSFQIIRNGEGVRYPFYLQDDIRVDAGEYWNTRYSGDISTFSSRTFSGSAHVDWGDYFSGSSVQSNYTVSWRTSKFLTIGLNYEKNWVNLPRGSFETDLIGTRLDYAFTPDVFGSVFAQWNDQDELALLNYRLQWIPKLGTRFFLILNQQYTTDNNVLAVQRTSILGKLIWRFVI